jgi:hypothetical protein
MPTYDILGLTNYPGFSPLPPGSQVTNIKVVIRHMREGGAVIGSVSVEAALTIGGLGPYGHWFTTVADTTLSDWVIEGPPSHFGLASINPANINSAFGVVYRRALLADEIPIKTRYIDSAFLEITYTQPYQGTGGAIVSGAAYSSCTQSGNGGVIMGGAGYVPSIVHPSGGAILQGSAIAARFSQTYLDNPEAVVPDVRVRGARTDRIENWYRCSKTGMWYPASRIRTVNGVIMGDDVADEPLRFPQGLDEE